MLNKATQMIGTSMVELDTLIPVSKDAPAEASFTNFFYTLQCFCCGRREGNEALDSAACCVLAERVGDLVLLNELSSNPGIFNS